MSWSPANISFRMAGTGNWQVLLPDAETRQLYAQIYPGGQLVQQIEDKFRDIIMLWQKADIATTVGGHLVPLGPIMMSEDLQVLNPWFDDISDDICRTIRQYLPHYKRLANNLSGGSHATKDRIDNMLTILVCAEALDIWTFRVLRHRIIGPHPNRAPAGRFFFWGYAFSNGPGRIFGVTTYGRGEAVRISVIRSHGLNRGQLPGLLRDEPIFNFIKDIFLRNHAGYPRNRVPKGMVETILRLREIGLLEPDEPLRLSVPILTDGDIQKTSRLHTQVSSEITSDFGARMANLRDLISQCSFAKCSLTDVLSMIFHLAYPYATDRLVLTETIPDFPQQAGGEWGVWLRLIGK